MAVYLDWKVPKVLAAGYDESDINSMGRLAFPCPLTPSRLYRILKFTGTRILSEPAVTTVKAGFTNCLDHIPEANELENRICGECETICTLTRTPIMYAPSVVIL
jgi:hypothetical protein